MFQGLLGGPTAPPAPREHAHAVERFAGTVAEPAGPPTFWGGAPMPPPPDLQVHHNEQERSWHQASSSSAAGGVSPSRSASSSGPAARVQQKLAMSVPLPSYGGGGGAQQQPPPVQLIIQNSSTTNNTQKVVNTVAPPGGVLAPPEGPRKWADLALVVSAGAREFLASPLNRFCLLSSLGVVFYIYQQHLQHKWRMRELQRVIDSNGFLRIVQQILGNTN